MTSIRPPRRPTADRLTRSALAYLERYASSTENLRRVLQRRVDRYLRSPDAEPVDREAIVAEAVRRCLAAGLVDDKAYAAQQVASQRRKGRSRAAIVSRLRSKGVGADDVAASLGAEDEVGDDVAARRAAQRKRIGPWRSDGRAEKRDRDIAALCRAGFSVAAAKAAIDGEPERS